MSAGQPSRAPTILVVDDNADNRALAEATLEEEQYATILASSGVEALDAFAAHDVDCVLLDVRMPGMDGFEVCSRIRAMPRGSDVPIVFITAIRDLDTFDAAQAAGADDFLTKPVRPTELALRVKAALKLRQMGAELNEHYQLVRRQRDDLMRLQLQKERLMAFVVHDLKNPVNTMDLYAQLLTRDKSLPEETRLTAETIRGEARSLTRLILNLLDITKSDEGKLVTAPTEVDVAALAVEIVSANRATAAAVSVSLSNDIEACTLIADVDLLRRMLENLVDNAIRHAPRDSTVRLAATAADGAVELHVSDEGKGIDPDKRALIFERHVQLEGASATRTGRGLGLAFCKAAAVAHGGDIWVRDDDAPGATFCIRLPQ